MKKVLYTLLSLFFVACHEEDNHVPEFSKMEEVFTHFHTLPDSVGTIFLPHRADTLFIVNSMEQWEHLTSQLHCPEILQSDSADFDNHSVLLLLTKNFYPIRHQEVFFYESNQTDSYYKMTIIYYIREGDANFDTPDIRLTTLVLPTKIASDSQFQIWSSLLLTKE